MTRSRFIVVEHHATKARLHWDLRFQMPNSKNWASFAIRKGVPLTPGQKVLAVRTHDHTEEEALFIGKIKEGYGAGILKKWDDGQCIINKFAPGHISIEFKGRKLKGLYHMVSTGVIDKDYKRQTYILFKGKVVSENYPEAPSIGMMTRVPPSDTEDQEMTDDQADKQQIKPLPWASRSSSIGKPHYSHIIGGLKSRMWGMPDSEDEGESTEPLPWAKRMTR